MSENLTVELNIEGARFPTAMAPSLRDGLARVQLISLIIGLVFLGLSTLGVFFERSQFFFSYLFGYLFWLQLSLGCFLVAMIHALTGGRWGYPTRRFLEAGFMVLPLMLLLFVPIFFGLSDLYPWARPEDVASEKVLQERHVYQNSWAFIGRVIFFLGVWIGMVACLRKWSLQQDKTSDAAPTRKARTLSGAGIVIYSLLATFAFVDWIMSLEKHWYSTIFAVIIIIGQILVAYAFAVVAMTLFKDYEPLVYVVTRTQYHHLGNLLLTFVLFWTYISFGQLLIIYAGDLPHEIDWYLHRIAKSWKVVVAAIGLFHFFLPFFLLLFRGIKRRVAALTTMAMMLFIVHVVDTYWLVMPTFHQQGVRVSWLDFAAPIGIGGLWVAVFLVFLRRAPLLPQHDPGLQFAFKYGH
jgi:hypothetical protein